MGNGAGGVCDKTEAKWKKENTCEILKLTSGVIVCLMQST